MPKNLQSGQGSAEAAHLCTPLCQLGAAPLEPQDPFSRWLPLMLGKSALALLLLCVGLSKDHLGLLTAWWLVAKSTQDRGEMEAASYLRPRAWKLAVFILP